MIEARVEETNQHGPVYWFFVNMIVPLFVPVRRMFAAHKVAMIVLCAMLVLAVLLFRETWQPAVVLMRRYAVPFALVFLFLYLVRFSTKRAHFWKQGIAWAVALLFLAGAVAGYEYYALWVRYNSLNIEYLEKGEMPETDHERLLPLSAVHSTVKANTGDSKTPTEPVFVRKKEGAQEVFHWSMAVEPNYWWRQVFGAITEVWSLPGNDPALRLSPEKKKVVNFVVGPSLWLASKSHTAAVRTFGPIRFLSYEAHDERFLEDDNGEVVQIISLLRWRGFLAPYPEFGGVLVIRQVVEDAEDPNPDEDKLLKLAKRGGKTFLRWAKRVLFGEGEWVRPERINEFLYLRGQNIMPYKASEYVAESFRFMGGILAPLPQYHEGDVRVPDPEDDTNRQPYATYFKALRNLPGMLYHYFSLEPYLKGRHGQVASILIPADGTNRVFVYPHQRYGENLNGVSNIAGQIRASRRDYKFGTENKPIEHRPYVKVINGVKRFLWLTTIVTVDKDGKIVVGKTELTITDPASTSGDDVFWVNPAKQEDWPEQLRKK